jgi:Cys-tRNA synthase (O-phospho-L-seryl-tRNA:Cys-tRNA synthase)
MNEFQMITSIDEQIETLNDIKKVHSDSSEKSVPTLL